MSTIKKYKGLEDDSMDTEENQTYQKKVFDDSPQKQNNIPSEMFDSNRDSINETDAFPSTSIISSQDSRSSNPFNQKDKNDRDLWRNKSILGDYLQYWLTDFINFSMTQEQITEENMMYLNTDEKSVNLFHEWCQRDGNIHDVIKKLTIKGILKYGFQLVVVEISTISSIYLVKVILDYLENPDDHPSQYYPWIIFTLFCVFRFISIVIRNYYDLYVYNYFKFVQNAITAWLYQDVTQLNSWQVTDAKRASILNILTKDVGVFVNGSWQFPYLLVVPVNTIISATILYSMFGKVILLCYVGMFFLLFLQYWSNKKLATIQYGLQQKSDRRIMFLSEVLQGIRQIKCKVQEKFFENKINHIRGEELSLFSRYVNIKYLFALIYQNSGVLNSSIIFLIADKSTLEIGNVFSTLALLGYVFNFSILYSNYAIEALYSLKVFNKRIKDVIESSFEKQQYYKMKGVMEATIIDEDQDFQSQRQITKKPSLFNSEPNQVKEQGGHIKLENIYSQWNVNEDQDTGEDIESENYTDVDIAIRDISFEFKEAEKIAVIGKVGCGKTSLLLTILKELCIMKGKIQVNSKDITYAEQNPLIMTGTVRQNILFGLPFNSLWYNQVIEACALKQDFTQLSKGDMTKLGEMGTQLSGGQKSRISLARALYKKDSKIVLIDGTLSSLDARVARHIMDKGIKELCKDKIVFLVTYDLDQAAEMEYVMLMDDGKIKELKPSREFFEEIKGEDQAKKLQEMIEKKTATLDEGESMKEQVVKDEKNFTGKIKLEVYKKYFGYSSPGGWTAFIVFFLHFLINLNSLAVSLFLAFTLTRKFGEQDGQDPNSTTTEISYHMYNITLVGIMFSSFLTSFFGKYISNKLFMQISSRLHDHMVKSIIHTKVKFFDENTKGRILNRFSRDVSDLDVIVYTYLDVCDYLAKCSITLFIIMTSCPWMIILAFVSGYFLYKYRRINLHITRDTYRLKASLMSPINSLIQDTLNGLTTIRSFCRGQYFLDQLFLQMDNQTSAFITSSSVNRWCAFRIDMQAYYIASLFAIFALFISNPQNKREMALVAVGFQLAVEIARHFNTAVRWTATFENDMIAVQRLLQFTDQKNEKKEGTRSDVNLKGDIVFTNVEMSYSKKLKPALYDLNFRIQQGDKVAVVGRTGSGKSSMFQLFQGFRYPRKGHILINGYDLSTIDLSHLRSSLSVVLQSTFIIGSENIRNNLDPEGKHTDDQIMNALQKALLTDFNPHSASSNLSTGQIQLLSLANAFLRTDSKILLLDEPTSQIDGKTQNKVLKNIFQSYKNATCLMIAHRLETAVKFCDKILVLDMGRLVEYDHPFKLLCDKIEDDVITKHDGVFASMVSALNENQQRKILKIAKDKYLK